MWSSPIRLHKRAFSHTTAGQHSGQPILSAFNVGTEHARLAPKARGLCLNSICALSLVLAVPAQNIGNHPAVYDEHGILLPWTPWRDAIQREVNWYLNCPVENG